MITYVVPIDGRHRGRIGYVHGNFEERRVAMPKAKLVVVFEDDKNRNYVSYLATRLREATMMEKLLVKP